MGSISPWPQTAHFNPLHKPLCGLVQFAKWGDYSNLARNTSTSDLVTPFCFVWPLNGGCVSQNKHPPCLSALVYASQWVDSTVTQPNVDVCFTLWLKMNAPLTAPGICLLLIKRDLLGAMIWDDLVIWFLHVLKYCESW